MPEYPDIVVYIERLEHFVQGRRLEQIRVSHPFLLRTAVPPITEIEGLTIQGFERIGKRIVFVFEKDHFLVLHLMVSGRLRWRRKGVSIKAKQRLAAMDFETGSLLLTEASSRKRASSTAQGCHPSC